MNECENCKDQLDMLHYVIGRVLALADSLDSKDKMISTKIVAEEIYGAIYDEIGPA
jgi:hypothetical protein